MNIVAVFCIAWCAVVTLEEVTSSSEEVFERNVYDKVVIIIDFIAAIGALTYILQQL